jgi:hypothetical protein
MKSFREKIVYRANQSRLLLVVTVVFAVSLILLAWPYTTGIIAWSIPIIFLILLAAYTAYNLSYKLTIENGKVTEEQAFHKPRELAIEDIEEIKHGTFFFAAIDAFFTFWGPSFANQKFKRFPRYAVKTRIIDELKRQNPKIKLDEYYLRWGTKW